MTGAASPVEAVIVADCVIALSVARSLGRHGIPVIAALARSERTLAYRRIVQASRYVHACHDFDEQTYDDALIDSLIGIAQNLRHRPVLFPVSDRGMLAISRYRGRLASRFRMSLPPHETLVMLLNKDRFCLHAKRHDLPIPVTHTVECAADADGCADGMRFPCIVKPPWRTPAWVERYGSRKVLVAASPSELRKLVQNELQWSPTLVVQECLDGPETNIVSTFTYLDENSRPLGVATCRKLRQFPVGFGSAAMAEIVEDEEAAGLTRSICEKLGLVGYVSIEFKRDPSDRGYKIIEITPSRLDRHAGITDLSVMNVALTWYAHLTGMARAPSSAHVAGGRWVSEIYDLRALPSYLRAGTWSVASWLGSYQRVRRWEIFAPDDFRPALVFPGLAASRAARQLVTLVSRARRLRP